MEHGAHQTVHIGHEDPKKDYDVVFDASGAAPAIEDGLSRVRRYHSHDAANAFVEASSGEAMEVQLDFTQEPS